MVLSCYQGWCLILEGSFVYGRVLLRHQYSTLLFSFPRPYYFRWCILNTTHDDIIQIVQRVQISVTFWGSLKITHIWFWLVERSYRVYFRGHKSTLLPFFSISVIKFRTSIILKRCTACKVCWQLPCSCAPLSKDTQIMSVCFYAPT